MNIKELAEVVERAVHGGGTHEIQEAMRLVAEAQKKATKDNELILAEMYGDLQSKL